MNCVKILLIFHIIFCYGGLCLLKKYNIIHLIPKLRRNRGLVNLPFLDIQEKFFIDFNEHRHDIMRSKTEPQELDLQEGKHYDNELINASQLPSSLSGNYYPQPPYLIPEPQQSYPQTAKNLEIDMWDTYTELPSVRPLLQEQDGFSAQKQLQEQQELSIQRALQEQQRLSAQQPLQELKEFSVEKPLQALQQQQGFSAQQPLQKFQEISVQNPLQGFSAQLPLQKQQGLSVQRPLQDEVLFVQAPFDEQKGFSDQRPLQKQEGFQSMLASKFKSTNDEIKNELKGVEEKRGRNSIRLLWY